MDKWLFNVAWKYIQRDMWGISSVQSLSHVWLFVNPWTAAHQTSLSITNSQILLKLMSMESVMPSNHFILCYPHLLLPSIIPSIGVFSSESVLRIRGPKYWSFSFSISPSNEYLGFISGLTSLILLPFHEQNEKGKIYEWHRNCIIFIWILCNSCLAFSSSFFWKILEIFICTQKWYISYEAGVHICDSQSSIWFLLGMKPS